MEEVLTLEEVAEKLRLNERTVTRLINDGKLRGIRIGNRYRIPRIALDEFLQLPKDRRGEPFA